ncbi:ORF41 [Ictalurid herpesvirus 1]|uniref:Uncharacterized protein ORF41 n=1 Tax=Ictalurid herpesvirus 1 (strain Auburn) TaxID=766178 RepID=VG41_ICHVA|nr:ORF41 [Ictalurid herpesvirus 1]Q00117.1 RecName: Full=Uncharacterized protein ORF41 [Ictalurid herpesvirus 1 (strain Auburn)]AAA88144.1 ORF41 [Ictalurid herpesvirus 1]
MYLRDFHELAPSQTGKGYEVFFVVGFTKAGLKLGRLVLVNKRYLIQKKGCVTIPNKWMYWDPFQAFVVHDREYLQIFFRSLPEVIVNQLCLTHRFPQVSGSFTREICGFATDWIRNLVVSLDPRSEARLGLQQRLSLVDHLKTTFPDDYLDLRQLPPSTGGLYTTVSTAEMFNPTGTPDFLAAFDALFEEGGGTHKPPIQFPTVRFDKCEGTCEAADHIHELTRRIIGEVRRVYISNATGKVIPLLVVLTAVITAENRGVEVPERVGARPIHATGNIHFDTVLSYVVQMMYLGKVRVCAP